MSDKNQFFHLSGNKKSAFTLCEPNDKLYICKIPHLSLSPTGVGYVWRVGCSGTPVPNAAPPPRQN